MKTRDPVQLLSSAFGEWPVVIGDSVRLAVAFSGGLDSTFLLALLARAGFVGQLRALHVDHGIHPSSASWLQHCESVAGALKVPFAARSIEVATGRGGNLERAAREARYQALSDMLQPEEILLTAHHADDQLETLIFRLVRGGGVPGLRGIVPFSKFGVGYLGRPLLDLARSEILAHATTWGLQWIEDPSNVDRRFDRNFLRYEIVPDLTAHWPRAPAAAVRVAKAMAEAEEILNDMARLDASGFESFDRLPCERIRSLSPARAGNLLRYVIGKLGVSMPNRAQLERLRVAAEDSVAQRQAVVWPGAEARTYKDHLFIQPPLEPSERFTGIERLAPGQKLVGAFGALELRRCRGIGIPDDWAAAGLDVSARVGGERFQPLGSPRPRALKKWFHEASIVPWMRDRIPLLMRQGEIVAVADLWLSDALTEKARGESNWEVVWTGHRRLR